MIIFSNRKSISSEQLEHGYIFERGGAKDRTKEKQKARFLASFLIMPALNFCSEANSENNNHLTATSRMREKYKNYTE